MPRLVLALGRGHLRPAEIDARVPLLVGTGSDDSFALVVDNETTADQRVEVRRLPPWLRVRDGPAVVDLKPGARATFRLAVVEGLAPARAPELGEPSGPTAGAPAGTFIVSSSDEAQTVGVWLRRAATARQIVGLGLLGALGLPGVIVLVYCLRKLVARPAPAGTDVERAFLERWGRSERRTARRTLAVLLAAFMVQIVVLCLFASAAP